MGNYFDYYSRYNSDDLDSIFSPSRYFDFRHNRSAIDWVKRNHKRLLFAAIALYILYRLTCVIFRLLYAIYQRLFSPRPHQLIPEAASDVTDNHSPLLRLLEDSFFIIFGLSLGALTYYAHYARSAEAIDTLVEFYRTAIHQIVFHSIGYDLDRSQMSSNETLMFGTALAAIIIYIALGMIRFLMRHYIFGIGLSLFGAFLYVYEFPITANTAATYSGTMFVVDRRRKVAHLLPSLIPKLLLTLTICYYLLLMLLQSVKLFFKMSFRILLFGIIFSILLNSITTMLRGNRDAEMDVDQMTTKTSYVPNYHQY